MPIDISIKFARLPHGLIYYYQHWIPHKPRALVVFLHGLGDHSGRYSQFIKRIVGEQCACAIYDQRGHGQTQGPRGHVAQFADWVDDLASFVQFSRSNLPAETPLIIVGYGLGALIGINYLLMHAQPVDGMVSISATLAPKVQMPRWKRELTKKFHGILPKFSVGNGIRFEDLSRDFKEVENMSDDNLFHRRFTLSTDNEIIKNLELLAGLPARIHVPMLMLAGSDDRICDCNASVWFTARLSSEDKECHIYPGMYHDLLHDIGKEKVMDDVAKWITARTQTNCAAANQYPLNQKEVLWENVS
ncbi:MAG: lysophospholipase [Pseudomonadota bacterium]